MKTAKSAMNVKRSSTLSVADTIVVFVVRYFVTDAVTWKLLDSSWGIQVRRKLQLHFRTVIKS